MKKEINKKTQIIIGNFYPLLSIKSNIEFLQQACLYLQKHLAFDYCFVGKFLPIENKSETVVVAHNNTIIDNFIYDLEYTPCELVFNKQAYAVYNDKLSELFPDDVLAKQMQLRGYIGYELRDSNNKKIGLLVGLTTQHSLKDEKLALDVFSNVAPLIEKRLEIEILKESESRKLEYLTELEDFHHFYNWEFDARLNKMILSDKLKSVLEISNQQAYDPEALFNLIDKKEKQRIMDEIMSFKDSNQDMMMYSHHSYTAKTNKRLFIQGWITKKHGINKQIIGLKSIVKVYDLSKPENNIHDFVLAQNQVMRKKLLQGLYWAKKVNGEYIIIDVSESLINFTGFKKEELIGMPCFAFSKLIIEGDVEKVNENWANELSFKNLVYKLKLPNNEECYVAHSNNFFEFQNQKYAIGTFEDINNEVNISKIKDFFIEISDETFKNYISIEKLLSRILLKLKEVIVFDKGIIEIEFNKNVKNFILDNDSVTVKSVRNLKIKKSQRYKSQHNKYNEGYEVNIPIKSIEGEGGSLIIYRKEKLTEQEKTIFEFVAQHISHTLQNIAFHQELLKNEKKFHELVEGAFDIIGTLNSKGEFEYISPAVKNILGYLPEEVIGKSFLNYFYDEDKKEALHIFKSRQSVENIITENIWRLIDKNGGVKFLNVKVKNRTENKQFTGVIFNAKDVTKEHLDNLLQKSINHFYKNAYQYTNFSYQIRPIFVYTQNLFAGKNIPMAFVELNDENISTLYYWDKHKVKVVNKIMLGEKQLANTLEKIIDKKKAQVTPVIIDGKLIGNWMTDLSGIDKNLKTLYINNFARLLRTFKMIYNNNLLKKQLDKKLSEVSSLLNALPDILYQIDNKGIIHFIKCDDEKNLIHNKREYLNKSLLELHHPKFAQKYLEVINRVLKNKKKEYYEYYLIKNKQVKFYNSVIAPYDKNSVLVLERDITEQKELNEKLVAEVIAAQEKEKNRFAKDMHDGLGQILLAAKMNLTALDSIKEKLDDYENDIYDKILSLLTKSVQEARNISHGLMSRSLREFGLHYALNEMISDLQNQELVIDFKSNIQDLRLEQNTEVAIYRIIQEIFNNIIKHSKADKVNVSALFEGNNLLLTISDNGKGFDYERIMKEGKGIGIQNIFTRVNYLNGEIELISSPGTGTIYQIKFNINPKLLSYEKN